MKYFILAAVVVINSSFAERLYGQYADSILTLQPARYGWVLETGEPLSCLKHKFPGRVLEFYSIDGHDAVGYFLTEARDHNSTEQHIDKFVVYNVHTGKLLWSEFTNSQHQQVWVADTLLVFNRSTFLKVKHALTGAMVWNKSALPVALDIERSVVYANDYRGVGKESNSLSAIRLDSGDPQWKAVIKPNRWGYRMQPKDKDYLWIIGERLHLVHMKDGVQWTSRHRVSEPIVPDLVVAHLLLGSLGVALLTAQYNNAGYNDNLRFMNFGDGNVLAHRSDVLETPEAYYINYGSKILKYAWGGKKQWKSDVAYTGYLKGYSNLFMYGNRLHALYTGTYTMGSNLVQDGRGGLLVFNQKTGDLDHKIYAPKDEPVLGLHRQEGSLLLLLPNKFMHVDLDVMSSEMKHPVSENFGNYSGYSRFFSGYAHRPGSTETILIDDNSELIAVKYQRYDDLFFLDRELNARPELQGYQLLRHKELAGLVFVSDAIGNTWLLGKDGHKKAQIRISPDAFATSQYIVAHTDREMILYPLDELRSLAGVE